MDKLVDFLKSRSGVAPTTPVVNAPMAATSPVLDPLNPSSNSPLVRLIEDCTMDNDTPVPRNLYSLLSKYSMEGESPKLAIGLMQRLKGTSSPAVIYKVLLAVEYLVMAGDEQFKTAVVIGIELFLGLEAFSGTGGPGGAGGAARVAPLIQQKASKILAALPSDIVETARQIYAQEAKESKESKESKWQVTDVPLMTGWIGPATNLVVDWALNSKGTLQSRLMPGENGEVAPRTYLPTSVPTSVPALSDSGKGASVNANYWNSLNDKKEMAPVNVGLEQRKLAGSGHAGSGHAMSGSAGSGHAGSGNAVLRSSVPSSSLFSSSKKGVPVEVDEEGPLSFEDVMGICAKKNTNIRKKEQAAFINFISTSSQPQVMEVVSMLKRELQNKDWIIQLRALTFIYELITNFQQLKSLFSKEDTVGFIGTFKTSPKTLIRDKANLLLAEMDKIPAYIDEAPLSLQPDIPIFGMPQEEDTLENLIGGLHLPSEDKSPFGDLDDSTSNFDFIGGAPTIPPATNTNIINSQTTSSQIEPATTSKIPKAVFDALSQLPSGPISQAPVNLNQTPSLFTVQSSNPQSLSYLPNTTNTNLPLSYIPNTTNTNLPPLSYVPNTTNTNLPPLSYLPNATNTNPLPPSQQFPSTFSIQSSSNSYQPQFSTFESSFPFMNTTPNAFPSTNQPSPWNTIGQPQTQTPDPFAFLSKKL